MEGLETAVEAINEGEFFWGDGTVSDEPGIMGRPIELVFEDTQANPNQALIAAQKLAGQGVAAIIGTTTSPDAIQARVACQEAEVPCLFPSVSAAAIVTPPNADYAFTMAPNFDVQAAELAKALDAAGHESATIVHDDSGTSSTLAESFAKAFEAADFEVASTEVIPATAQDVTSQVERIKDSGGDAIVDLLVPAALNSLFVRQLRTSGSTAALYGINPLVDPEIRSQIGPSIDEAVVIDQFDRSKQDVVEYTEYFHERNGDDTEVISTHLYMTTAMLILKAAIENAGATEGEAVKAELEQMEGFPSGFGQDGYDVSWTPNDHNGSGPGGVVFVVYDGLEIETWDTYQPSGRR